MKTRFPLDRLLVALGLSTLLAGCATGGGSLRPAATPLSPLQLREMQSRSFEGVDERQLTKAVVQALLDEGFIVSNVESDLGLITAVRELTDVQRGSRLSVSRLLLASVTYGAALLFPPSETTQTLRLEANVSITGEGDRFRVRASFVRRRIDPKKGLLESRPVEDARVYQSFFESADKAVFLAQQQL